MNEEIWFEPTASAAEPSAPFADWTARSPRPPNPIVERMLTGRTLAVEEIRILAARVRALLPGRDKFCVGTVSASASEGKTSLSIGLAGILASEAGRKVLLVEIDVRRPAFEAYMGLPRTPGLAEWLAGGLQSVPVRQVRQSGFTLLTAGLVSPPTPETLGGRRMAELLASARSSFDYIVLDCPPLTPVADSVLLQDLVDGFVFVVRARHSPREAVRRAIARIRPEKILGTVLNDRREMLPGYHSYGSRTYGRNGRATA
jgi:capsular exopolysaccharide synthesis family protein